MEKGVWPTSAKQDPLLMRFVGVLDLCAQVRSCDECPQKETCLRDYDGLVHKSSKDILTARNVEKAVTRFKPPLL